MRRGREESEGKEKGSKTEGELEHEGGREMATVSILECGEREEETGWKKGREEVRSVGKGERRRIKERECDRKGTLKTMK